VAVFGGQIGHDVSARQVVAGAGDLWGGEKRRPGRGTPAEGQACFVI